MRRSAATWLRRVAPALVAVALLGAHAVPAAAVTTTPGDAAGNAYTRDSVRAATWNMCGEAGGEYASAPGYCPWRNGKTNTGQKDPAGNPIYEYLGPEKKMKGVAKLINERNLNAVMLQEVCAGTTAGDTAGSSHLDELAALLPDDWTFASAGVTRPDEPYEEPERSEVELIDQEGSDCRGPALTGTLSIAIAVKGQITWKTEKAFHTPVDAGLSMNSGSVLCVEVAGWESHLCTTHISNFDKDEQEGRLDQGKAKELYDQQIATTADVVRKFPSVVLGGDFNTGNRDRIQTLYSLMAECDQRSYLPGDAANETTKFNRTNETLADPNGPDAGGYESYDDTESKIDYLFSTGGFTGCDSATEYGDRTNYRLTAQPQCTMAAKNCVAGDEAYSDHTPVYGYTQGGPTLSWKLDGSADATSGGSGGHTGVRTGGADWVPAEHGGALLLDGSDDTVTQSGPAVNTAQSFTVSAWIKVDPLTTATSAVLSQDGERISGMILWYNATDSSWRFGMPRADADGWSVDQAVAPGAVKGEWTRLTGVYDAAAGTISLFVNGSKKATSAHTARWSASKSFVVGRDLVNGAHNAHFKGHVQRVEAFAYPMRDDQVASYAGSMTAPTGKKTALQGPEGELSQGCHVSLDEFGNDFGTTGSLTPTLTAKVRHPDPSKDVWAEFSLWDNTSSTQILTLGTPGSRSLTTVKGQGTVSLTVPALTPGHSYGWRVRTADQTTNDTPVSANCHFRAPAA
ncbi:LamG-like jellyroll fold domain-containing protein [Streptomyces sp. SJL17-1]|uniref:LamG-like jellyroll fold domain-containing protein n=1 Tax=Streptomyces sp. SJL17-1 TaxID=2967223 RepID=UPI0029665063|nr:LamG-like jellyroll fold domain-containing protein [Streptomyces sp. SJL17-1]